jgi:hypothetical protein
MPDERDELLAAVHQLTAFTEGLLTLSERLLKAYDTDARPSAEELAAMREGGGANSSKALNSGSQRPRPSATGRCHSGSVGPQE